MAASQEFLNYLNRIKISRYYAIDEINEIIDDIKVLWSTLQSEYRRDNLFVSIDLQYLASACYELLTRFTVYEWDEVIAAAKDLHTRKNAGYSPSEIDAWANFRECTKFGIPATDGCLVRLSDKYTRFWNVYHDSSKDQVGESAIDTLRDLAAYSIILVVLLEENTNGGRQV